MAYADYEFYKNDYLGRIIDSETDYAYFAERASDELAPYAKCVPDTVEGQNALKRCSCRITDILYEDFKSSKNGQKISSESVSGYYSAGYAVNDLTAISGLLGNALNVYLGRYLFRAIRSIVM